MTLCSWENCLIPRADIGNEITAHVPLCSLHQFRLFEIVSRDASNWESLLRWEQRWCHHVYFIPSPVVGRVKIGYSTSIARRTEDYRRDGFDISAIVTARGSQEIEQEIHALFSDLALGGEYFTDDPAIWVLAGDLKAAGTSLPDLEHALMRSRTAYQLVPP
jgi:hypothetical protein